MRNRSMIRSWALALLAGLLASLLTSLLSGCGAGRAIDRMLPDERLVYRQAREAPENLELPPDLASARFDDALDIPPASGSMTLSSYTGEQTARTRIAGSGNVLPDVAGVSLRRADERRWLEVDASPNAVWPQVVGFWRQQGILLQEQDPAVGVMQTDWIENRAEIRTDFITRQLRRVVDGLYATSTRDRYRVRIDTGATAGTTEIHLTHAAMHERLVRNTAGEGTQTVWEPAASDPGKEAAMLRRLMLHLGISDRDADRMLAQGGRAETGIAPAPRVQLVPGETGATLILPEDFRRAWRSVGLALDRSGFAVEDRDRSNGVFYVRYGDTDQRRERPGLVGRLAFWRGDGDRDTVSQYQIRLSDGGSETRVNVHDEAGRPDASESAQRILSLLQEDLR
ncbi:MAG: outer membrane protein assembly factor BamC [Chromatiaceae bacterium]|nr:MAG: outer membrane protein assembly factor BamC [Chromatiaceae bacterium]